MPVYMGWGSMIAGGTLAPARTLSIALPVAPHP